MYEWFMDSTCMVLANGLTSQLFAISRSIKQGGMISMLNFCIYLMDVHQFLDQNSDCGLTVQDLYLGSPVLADDILVMSHTKAGLDNMIDMAVNFSQVVALPFLKNKEQMHGLWRVQN